MDEPSDPNATAAAGCGWYIATDRHGRSTTISGVTSVYCAPSWEGSGAAPIDGPEPAAQLAESIKRMGAVARAQEHGNTLSSAINALHGQRRPDGRPEFFKPDLDAKGRR